MNITVDKKKGTKIANLEETSIFEYYNDYYILLTGCGAPKNESIIKDSFNSNELCIAYCLDNKQIYSFSKDQCVNPLDSELTIHD